MRKTVHMNVVFRVFHKPQFYPENYALAVSSFSIKKCETIFFEKWPHPRNGTNRQKLDFDMVFAQMVCNHFNVYM